jgi:hypothetical protein
MRFSYSAPKKNRKKKIAALVMAFLGVAAVAWAVWLVTSTGNGYGRNGELQAPILQVVPAGDFDPAGDLFPGQTGDLYLKVNNPNAGALELERITPLSWESSDPMGCPSSYLNFPLGGQFNVTGAVPPGVSDHVIADALALHANAPTECQGLVWTINLEARFETA